MTLLVGVLLVSFLGGIIQGILLVVPSLLAEGNDVVAAFSSVVADTLGGVLTTPFTAAIVALIYFDQRVRKEGFDLQLLAEGMGPSATRSADARAADRPGGDPRAARPGAVLAAAARLDPAGAGARPRPTRRQPTAGPRTGRRRRAGSRRAAADEAPTRATAAARRAPTLVDPPRTRRPRAPIRRPSEPPPEAPLGAARAAVMASAGS